MRTQPALPAWIRVLLSVLIAVGISALTYWLSTVIDAATQPTRPASCLKEVCFCEASSGHFPEQLANAMSSFAFVFLGVWSVLSTRQPDVGTRERVLTPYFAITMLFVGVASFYYHATLSFVGQLLDILSMYTFGLVLFFGALYRCGRLRGRIAATMFVVLSLALAVLQIAFPEARRVLFALVLLPGIILELSPFVTGRSARSPRVRFVFIGVGILLVAYVIWLLDQNHLLCDPTSLLQGHAAWHILTALAAYMIFIHYRLTPHERR